MVTSMTHLPTWVPGVGLRLPIIRCTAVWAMVYWFQEAIEAAQINLTFVGEVMQGTLVNPVVMGFGIYHAMVPQAGGITTVHNYQPGNLDEVSKLPTAATSRKRHGCGV